MSKTNFFLLLIAFGIFLNLVYSYYKDWREEKEWEEAYEAYIEYEKDVARESKRLMKELGLKPLGAK